MYICLHPHSLIDDKKKIKMENVVELMYNISLFSDVVIPEYLSVEKTLQRPARKTSKAIVSIVEQLLKGKKSQLFQIEI